MSSEVIRPKLWTITDLAEYLNVRPKWIYERTQTSPTEGDSIPCIKLGRLLRFDPEAESFKAWLAAHTRG